MVAIRTAGLAFESLIGLVPNRTQDQDDGNKTEEDITRLVSEEYLEILVNIANKRFESNAERIQRFEEDLFRREEGPGQAWEDSKSRQERKRAEGLEQQQKSRKAQMNPEKDVLALDVDEDIDNAGLFGSTLPP